MSVLVYATESWILAIIGVAWMALREMFETRAFIEEFIIAGQLLASTTNLIFVSVSDTNNHNARAYFTITLCIFLIGAYTCVDSYKDFSIISVRTYNNNTSPTGVNCCPNANAALYNRKIYFAGFTFYLLPMAVTMGIQTVQVFVSAGALSHTQHNLWPGYGFSYTLLSLACATINIKLLGFITKPCPSTSVSLLGSWIKMDVFWFVVLFTNAFTVIGAAEDVINMKAAKVLWHTLGCAFIGLFTYTIWINFKDMNIITWPLASLLFIAGIPVLFMYVRVILDLWKDYNEPSKNSKNTASSSTPLKMNSKLSVRDLDEVALNMENIGSKTRVRTRFVFPMQTDFSSKITKRD